MLGDAALLHVLGDLLMSVGVVMAGVLIYFDDNLWFFDPLCTYLFSVIVMITTIPIVKTCVKVLMEGCPDNISTEDLRQALYDSNPKDNKDIHCLHVWSVGPSQVSMTAHIVSTKPLKSLAAAQNALRRKFKLHHATI